MSYETNEKNNGQYGKKGFKPRRSTERRTCDLDKIETNDPRYWNKAKNFENVSKFSWDLIVGYPRKWDNLLGFISPDDVVVSATNGDLNPAQIMAVDVILGPGYASNVNDGVNRALSKLMATIRSTLSTSNIGFETAELGYLFASTSSIAANIGYAKRVLESYTLWKDRNYAYPRMLIKMMGFEYSDIRDNIQIYAAKLNSLIDMYNNIRLLDMFDIYDRQYAMMHNVFCDEESELAQLYIFRPANFYVYNDREAMCENVNFTFGTPSIADFNDFLNIINTQINAWYGSSDLYQINGTLLRAFKDAPRQMIPYFEMNTQVEPVQDKAFLMQIMNCTICPINPASESLNITQDPTTQNFVIWTPSTPISNIQDLTGYDLPNNYGGTCLADKQILRLFDTEISQDDNMELTRLTNFAKFNPESGGEGAIDFANCGSEIVCRVTIATYDSLRDDIDIEVSTTSNIIPYDRRGQFASLVQAFRYIPCFIAVDTLGDPELSTIETVPLGILGDVYNWMLYDRVDWNLLQFAAYQSLWMPKNA